MSEFAYEAGLDSKKEKSSWKKLSTANIILYIIIIIGILISIIWLLLSLGIVLKNGKNTNQSFTKKLKKRDISFPSISEILYSDKGTHSHDTVNSCNNNICNSSDCYEKAYTFLNNMNTEVDPCDDFYQYVCGNFIKNTPIPEDDNKVDPIKIIEKRIDLELMIELEKKTYQSESSALQKTKKLYQICMNEALIQDVGTPTLLQIISDVGGWPVLVGSSWNEDKFTWIKTIHRLSEYGYPVTFPGAIRVTSDPKNSTNKFIQLNHPSTQVYQSFLKDGPNNKLLKAYYNYMVDIAVMMGATKYNALTEMKEALEFEINLHNIKSSYEELYNSSNRYNFFTFKKLSTTYPTLPLFELIKKIFEPSGINLDENEIINVRDPKFVSKLENLIKHTPKRVLANYLLWQIVDNSIDYLPDAYLDRKAAYEKILSGVNIRKQRGFRCLEEIKGVFKMSVSALYARKYFNTGFKPAALQMVQNIKNEFKNTLQQTDWLDEDAKKTGLEKLDAMDVFVAYTDEFFDDEKLDEYYLDLEINTDNYLLGSTNVSRFYNKRYYSELRHPAGKKDWTSYQNTAYVNAYYFFDKNSIEIPAGILQREYFDKYRQNYLNYGAMGSIIGHEITHGFDDMGRLFDKYGNQGNWWKTSIIQKYLEKSECFVEQYGNYMVKQVGLKVNGKLTLGENIADNGGFKLAYRAYDEWTKKNGDEKCLPVMNHTPRQMFWVSAASVWCRSQKSEDLRNKLARNPHSPATARIDISFSNIKEFSRDFNCKLGSKMNPVHKCAIW